MNKVELLQGLLVELTEVFLPYKIWAVGGAVRDFLLGNDIKDFDFATDADVELAAEILKGWGESYWDPGLRYGTVCAKRGDVEVQVTTLREDSYDGVTRFPETRAATSILADLERRDFTVNAMALGYNVVEKKFRLWYVGDTNIDLKHKIIDTPRDADVVFNEDPLRMIRAARFAAQLGFKVQASVLASMNLNAAQIMRVSQERITAELDKILALPKPSVGLNLLHKTTVWRFPNLGRVDDIPAEFLDARWAVLFDDYTPTAIRQILKAYKLPNDRVATITKITELVHQFHTFNTEWTRAKVRFFVHQMGALEDHVMHAVLSSFPTELDGYFGTADFARIYGELEPEFKADDLSVHLNGLDVQRILGIGQGPLIGKALKHLQGVRYELGPLTYDQYVHELRLWWEGKA